MFCSFKTRKDVRGKGAPLGVSSVFFSLSRRPDITRRTAAPNIALWSTDRVGVCVLGDGDIAKQLIRKNGGAI